MQEQEKNITVQTTNSESIFPELCQGFFLLHDLVYYIFFHMSTQNTVFSSLRHIKKSIFADFCETITDINYIEKRCFLWQNICRKEFLSLILQ